VARWQHQFQKYVPVFGLHFEAFMHVGQGWFHRYQVNQIMTLPEIII
jgi:hypothetical protein